MDLAVRDPHPVPVELSHDEAVEALVVGAAVVAQEPERLLLADEEAAHAVGAVVDARGVAAHTAVASTNKSLAQMSKSPGVGKATKRYRPEGDVGEAKNQHTSPTAAE